jgi:hypothetical protein
MRIHFIEAIESLEQSVIKNKWFTLACVTIGLAGGAAFYAVHDIKENVADCFREAEGIAYGSPRHSGEIHTSYGEKLNASVASGDLARAYFGKCLAVNGVDARSVLPFEDLFPQMTVSSNFQNESFDVLDSAVLEDNEDMHDDSAVE